MHSRRPCRSNAEWMDLITECRQSGLSDSAWCVQHDIPTSSFYNAVSRLRRMAYAIPDPADKARIQGIETCYIGSSYVDGTNIFDSNNEKLISAIRFGSTHFEGVDGQIDRLGKTKKIIDFHNSTGTNFQLKVCWNRVAGENCSNCEKCYRTIMGIVANGGKPNDFGFTVNNETFQRIKKMLKNSKVNEAFWIPIVDSFKANKSQWKDNPNLSWILHTKVNSPAVLAKKALRKIGIK